MSKQLLDGKRGNLFWMDPDDLVIIGIDTKDGPEHRLWDERVKLPIDEALVENLLALGVREPILVEVDGGKPVVVDGRRRVIHARAANKRISDKRALLRIPVVGAKGTEEDKLDLLSVSLNEQRLNDTIMTRAAKAARMQERGHTPDEIGNAFGVNVQTVNMWLAIAGLAAPVRKAIDAGTVAPTAAAKLAKLSKEEQVEALEALVAEGGKVTVGRTTAAANNKRKKNGKSDAVAAPPRRALRRVVERWESTDEGEEISEDFIRGVRFAIGELAPASVAGLTALMRKPEKTKE